MQIRDLTKIYRQGEINVTALDNISLDIASGEFLTLMGPSGSGKSTLLHIIAGIDRPTSGTCRVQDIDVADLNESELAAALDEMRPERQVWAWMRTRAGAGAETVAR